MAAPDGITRIQVYHENCTVSVSKTPNEDYTSIGTDSSDFYFDNSVGDVVLTWVPKEWYVITSVKVSEEYGSEVEVGTEANSYTFHITSDTNNFSITITTALSKFNAVLEGDLNVNGNLRVKGSDVASMGGKRTARFVIGTSNAGWTSFGVDYLCDGVDDDVEINAAIQALPSTGGEIIILDGTYNLTASVIVDKNKVALSGNGKSTILQRMHNTSSTFGLIHVTSSNNTIQNLTIDGFETSYTSSNNYGIYLYSSNNNTVTGNICNNNSGNGIYLYSSNNNTVTGNICNNNSGNGIYLESSSSDNTVTGNTCNDNKKNGIHLKSSIDYNTVTGNTCNDNRDCGIYLFSAKNNAITGNVCKGSEYSIYLASSSNNNTVTGNACNRTNTGIYLTSSSNNTVTGNTCNSDNVGIYLTSSSNNTVTGNTCIRGTGTASDYAATQYTIQIKSGDNNLIVGNNIMGKNYVDDGSGNTWADNKYQ